ncbi:FAD-binding protein [Antarcticibacterium flavum]|uniref:FAD-binding protein n=1 Tax=Antarcticibacterium flavum TaxID=2058175 RepID=A0A5B7WYN6_9FLAO|nr:MULTISPECIES: FAD-dependent monooxygenase [Antarcticibacterium]MCM4158921.1 hypothetical protein [Antarcticibacterium sp. W02-3]QCY68177.1 FAD-binding protein [Antarcticibacterium flavum]
MGRKNSQNGRDVIIIGGGPTGLSLGLGLARQGVSSVILEKKEAISRHSKAPVIHQRTREIFRQWGIEEEFLKDGNLVKKLTVNKANSHKVLFSLNFNHLEKEARDPGMLVIEQNKTEKILLEAIRKTKLCSILFSNEVVQFEQNSEGVKVWSLFGEEEQVHFGKYLIGCDGASSFIREGLNLPFKGKTYNVRTVLADVRPGDKRNELPWPRLYNGKKELTVGIKIADDLWRLIHLETSGDKKENKEDATTTAEVDKWVNQTLGDGKYTQVWASPFDIHRRSSPVFRKERVILAGDAAHVHSPVGGQGMNAGIQDSHNLAWKLAVVINNTAMDELLDSYEKERVEAVVEEVSGNTDFLTKTFLQSPSFFRKTAFFVLRRILSVPFLRNKFLRRAMMINIGYKNSSISSYRSKAEGKRLPDVLLIPGTGEAKRLYDYHSGKPLVILIGGVKDVCSPFAVIRICQKLKDPSGLLVKLVPGDEGYIFVRPDLHIDWAGKNRKKFLEVLKQWKRIIPN